MEEALPTILNILEVLFIVAIILEQNHPGVHSLLSKNNKFKKWLTVIVL